VVRADHRLRHLRNPHRKGTAMRKRQPRPYYTLVVHEGDHIADNPWGIAFGDYDLDTVEAERDEYRDKGWKAKELKIITTTDKQADIDAAVHELNEAET
jgi:hypothetical protein